MSKERKRTERDDDRSLQKQKHVLEENGMTRFVFALDRVTFIYLQTLLNLTRAGEFANSACPQTNKQHKNTQQRDKQKGEPSLGKIDAASESIGYDLVDTFIT
jgi:hypothetical protein